MSAMVVLRGVAALVLLCLIAVEVQGWRRRRTIGSYLRKAEAGDAAAEAWAGAWLERETRRPLLVAIAGDLVTIVVKLVLLSLATATLIQPGWVGESW